MMKSPRVLTLLLSLLVTMTQAFVVVPSPQQRALSGAVTRHAAAALSKEQDLQWTIEVIQRHWNGKSAETTDRANQEDEQQQRALLTTRLEYEQRVRAKTAARRSEQRQRALLRARLDSQARQMKEQATKQSQIAEVKQRALLTQRIQLEKTTRQSKQVDAYNLSTREASSQLDSQREASRKAEAQQRALLQTRLQWKQPKVEEPLSYDDVISSVLLTNMPSLIRIACAYSESQEIRPSLVETASVVSLSADTLEIAMLVCEGEGCVNVAVPVRLPNSCHGCATQQDLQTCMMGNLQTLDQMAHVRIEQAERVDVQHEQWQQLDRLHMELQAAPEFGQDLPSWWTTGDVEIQRECDGLKEILNRDEFMTEIRLLAQQNLVQWPEWMSDDDAPVVTKAAVALVGSSGLFLRAQIRNNKLRTTNVPIPVRFPRGKLALVEALREAVLELVDNVVA